jgi:hypothetical protein
MVYSKIQAQKLQPKSFAAMTKSGVSVCSAYLKENAAKKLGVTVGEVYVYGNHFGGNTADTIVEQIDHMGNETYSIEYKA